MGKRLTPVYQVHRVEAKETAKVHAGSMDEDEEDDEEDDEGDEDEEDEGEGIEDGDEDEGEEGEYLDLAPIKHSVCEKDLETENKNIALSEMTKLTLDLIANKSLYHQYLGLYEPNKMEKIHQENIEIIEKQQLILETTKQCIQKIAKKLSGGSGVPSANQGPSTDVMDAFLKFAKRVLIEQDYVRENKNTEDMFGDCVDDEDVYSRVNNWH